MAFVLMALHALLVGRLREEDEERGMAGKEGGREGINHFVRKVRSIILISIDHRRTDGSGGP